MRPEARTIGQALLDHHRATTQAYPPGTKHIISARYTISYTDLCQRAGVPHVRNVIGGFLGEIAEWCANNHFPPLNALAINHAKGMPGDGYDNAGGFLLVNWPADVEACVRFTGYPASLP